MLGSDKSLDGGSSDGWQTFFHKGVLVAKVRSVDRDGRAVAPVGWKEDRGGGEAGGGSGGGGSSSSGSGCASGGVGEAGGGGGEAGGGGGSGLDPEEDAQCCEDAARCGGIGGGKGKSGLDLDAPLRTRRGREAVAAVLNYFNSDSSPLCARTAGGGKGNGEANGKDKSVT